MELGSVTLKRIGFFCFPIKHSTHTPTSLHKLEVIPSYVQISENAAQPNCTVRPFSGLLNLFTLNKNFSVMCTLNKKIPKMMSTAFFITFGSL